MERVILLLAAVGLFSIGCASHAHRDDDSGAIAKLLPTAQVTLQQGLTAAEQNGQPIAGKFEVDEGGLELSIYTVQGARYVENGVDTHAGTVREIDTISSGDDLSEAKAHSQAMATAKKSLKTAVDQAEQQFAGYRAIRVTPKREQGHSVAVVMLVSGTESKTTSVSLE